eukprot:TRINITY_DN2941_c0_g1_i1.p1 TRINITY_DN2941_c0_g1~~TRINITY_DN2941_c0_g1_i1.p1  ORF type:complete len:797 (+),score=230.10 TRINITY_DN2941_c0_g1_i1:159-2549(+)
MNSTASSMKIGTDLATIWRSNVTRRSVSSFARSKVQLSSISPLRGSSNGFELVRNTWTNTLLKSSLLPKIRFEPSSRSFCAEAAVNREFADQPANTYQKKIRNIGISAHIDSGKTTLTERVLYYTGRINQMHEVRGKDNVGATMDFMDLEREKGITIQSAATYCTWGDNRINIIDTPGHVDFTIEVERALRVLDGAVLVMCGVAGVQSQTITVDRQMRRYNVPRLVFINKLDRSGAEPYKIVNQLRQKLRLNATLIQIPIGLEQNHQGFVDLVTKEAVYFEGPSGDTVRRTKEIPKDSVEKMNEKREEMLNKLADADDVIAEKVMEGVEPTVEELKAAIRRATIGHKFTPVLLGTALKNKGIQSLLDGVIDYLPTPLETNNTALDVDQGEKKIVLQSDANKPFVGLAFKLEEGRFGQLTYMRVYQGILQRGDFLVNVNTGKKIKVPRLVRMHANDMEDIQKIGAGEICAMFGVDCASGNSFTNGDVNYTMTSMHIPDPVMSLSISVKNKTHAAQFAKALAKFTKEDPTFRVKTDQESGETIISGMGELHLEVYVERMKREYNVEAIVGKPQVAYRETIQDTGDFAYTHKKQTGGAGQYAKVCGFLEPVRTENEDELAESEFVDATVGASIPPNFIPACRKGFEEIIEKGPLTGQPVVGVRMVVNDGAYHAVDSSELAFRIATVNAFKEAIKKAAAIILEPVMMVEVNAPAEFQSALIGALNKRKGMIQSSTVENDYVTITAEVPLDAMFGYSTDLRSVTQGKGEFSMEYKRHQQVTRDRQKQLEEAYKKKVAEERK